VRSRKGNLDVIDAIARIAAQTPQARLLIVGARNPTALYEQAEARGVRDLVHVLGYREDVPAILRASDCCVDASWEGHGLTGALREALAVGTPVVATNLEGNRAGTPRGHGPARAAARRPRWPALLTLAAARRARAMDARGELVVARFSTRVKVEGSGALPPPDGGPDQDPRRPPRSARPVSDPSADPSRLATLHKDAMPDRDLHEAPDRAAGAAA
jgi:hypothetical protein